MFDGSLPEIGEFAALSDAALVDAAGGWGRAEAAACARKQAVMAEIFARRTGLDANERELWWVDPEAAVAAELAAALNVSACMALHQTHRGVALRDRLPNVAALFEAGLISDLLVRAIVWRTYLIDDPEAMANVDASIAEQVVAWGPLSVAKTEQAIDALVERFDPGALRRSRGSSQYRDVSFGSPSDEAGYTSMWARLLAGDAKVLEQRVNEIAGTVCEADPRTLGERRSDALTALAANQNELACQCGDSECAAAGRGATAPVSTVVYVVADADAVAAAQEAPPTATAPVDGEPAAETPPRAETARPDTAPAAQHRSAPSAFVIGGGILPTPLLAATLERATLREVRHPGIDASPEPRYRPSTGLARFVRCRDLTCRWPGCDKPADACDLDHTVPYPLGFTHASNMKCLCRFHHLMKTFCGWRDRQLSNGTVVWTAPTGHTYTTRPGSAELFPTLCRSTGELRLSEPESTTARNGNRGAMMPKRRHTRAENRARAKAAERRRNDDLVAERNKPPPI
jgi:hypothetical protein